MSDTYRCGHQRTPENTIGCERLRCKTCHYAYAATYQRPERTPESLRRTIEQRTQRSADGCLIWTGALDTDGYPKIACGPRGTKIRYAHRINWELLNGPIPDGLHLSRRLECPNRRCIEPAHLELLKLGSAAGRATAMLPARQLGPNYPCGHPREGAERCRPCNREANRAWRQNNPDAVKAYRERRKAEQKAAA